MSNSPLVNYTRLSPNCTTPRNHKIDTITIHCVVGQLSVEAIGKIFASKNTQASSNYGIGSDGRIGMYVEEKNRSWCSSNRENDHRAVTIEVACDPKHPYAVNDAAYKSLIELVADICERNNIKELLWKGDKSLIGKVDKQNMTVHRWFANKACPGEYLYERHGEIAAAVNKKLGALAESRDSASYSKDKNYTLQAAMKVRTGPGTSYTWKKRSQLTKDGQKHAQSGTYAVLKKGTRVTVQKVVKKGNDIWLKIPSGYICAKQGSKVYVK